MKKMIVTGGAGFVGSHTALKFAESGFEVIAVDNFAPYYSVELKKSRVATLLANDKIRFIEGDLADPTFTSTLIKEVAPKFIIHLAAQPGVRLPIAEHYKYVDSNLSAFSNVILSASEHGVKNFLYASSSSVYGNSENVPFSESDLGIEPISFYGATKLSNEILARSISDNFGMKTRGLRFFTVYGPWGRPDMAYFKLASALKSGESFSLYGDGKVLRDFTYIDDVVESIFKLTSQLEENNEKADVVNVGGSQRYSLIELIKVVESSMGKKVQINFEEKFIADVRETWADTSYLDSLVGFTPQTDLQTGIGKFADWFNSKIVWEKLPSWNI